MSALSLPILGVTLGDVAGVGPEVVVKALIEEEVLLKCRPLVLGDAGALRQTIKFLGLDLSVKILKPGEEPVGLAGTIELLPLSELGPDDLAPGRPTRAGARAAAGYIRSGAELALAGRIHGLVTAPVSKEQVQKAVRSFKGHTEMLADLAGNVEAVMMLAGARLRVVLVTTHEAHRDVPGLLTVDRIVTTARITDQALKRYFGLPEPRLAAAALNPHAGEGGLFGGEEEEIIRPSVAEAQRQGLGLSGPFPADTLFYRAAAGEFDAVVCMYHDQGLIPFKMLHFKDGVNVTLGLPFIRTSVDHGTAYELAGAGRADKASRLAALRMAAQMAGIQDQPNRT